ncbi:MAG: hypothetical protein K8J31_14585, partial [Anaerolineae bacterium]|nr:hypothetical protein [Anaerolineae bacterium]
MVEWAYTLRDAGIDVAWYALDEQDNDPARFSAYLLSVFRSLNQGFHDLPDAKEHVHLQEAVNHILNAALAGGSPVVLVLDDYHLIHEPQIHDAVSRMCEYLPANMRLAIGTRADPPLQLARLRARGEVVEIRMNDLRFRTEELAQWLQSSLAWDPSKQMIDQLETLTEGWIAALSLILMALNKSPAPVDERALADQLARFSQTQRHVFDYFAQEVLQEQSGEIQQFLLDTCGLDHLHPRLCAMLADNKTAPLLLNQIATESLFVIPLSDREPIYRYHHLFQNFLQQYSQIHDPAHYLQKHRQAAEWYAAQDDMVEAVRHGLASEDFDYAAYLIEDRAWEVLTSRGEIMTILSWLPRFPDEALRRHPRLCLYFSRALYLTGDSKQSQAYVQLATDVLAQNPDQAQEPQAMRAIAFNYQATLAAYRGDIESGLRWIKQAAGLKDFAAGLDRVRIANTEAYLQYLMGDVLQARRTYQHALDLARQMDHDYLTLDAHYYLAQIDLLEGQLQAVLDRYDAVQARYTTRIGPLSAILLPVATVHYQRNQIVEAEAILREAIALARRANIPDILWLAHILLADVLIARGETAEAAASIMQAQRYAQGFHSPMMGVWLDAARARLMLRSGQPQAALDWAAEYQRTEKTGNYQDDEKITLAQIWLAQGDNASALSLSSEVIAEAQPAGRTSSVITAEMLRALAYQASGDTSAALLALYRALALAQPHGVVRLFLDMGQPMLRLLRQAIEHNPGSGYANHLLSIATQIDGNRHPADTLTEREIEVLERIADGSSN